MRIPKKATYSILSATALVLVAAYVFQINALTALAYHTAQTERSIRELKEQTTAREMEARQGMSLQDLQTLAQLLHFEKVETISYVKPTPASVAQNR